MSEPARHTITEALRHAIVDSGLPFQSLEQETGVTRASISRFVAGKRSLRLDKADRLAAYFGLVVKVGERGSRRGKR
jgi:plasmid maintenance system antidote protein VapI